MLSEPVLTLNNVWKKYSLDAIFHRSFREDLMRLFRSKGEDDLNKNEFWALKEVNFSIGKGDAIGLYGHNGAGKSTILKMLAGITLPTLGSYEVQGRVAPLIEIGAGFHPDLTGRENVMMNGAILGMKISEIKRKFDSILNFSGLGSFIEMPVKKFSSGMYLRLAFSIAIHSEADIYLIDEIISVGDSEFQEKCLDRVIKMKSEGKTLIIVSHDLSLLKRVVDSVVFMEHGTVREISKVNN